MRCCKRAMGTETLQVEQLPPAEWLALDAIFAAELDQYLPHPQDRIVVVRAGDEIAGFAVVEVWIHFGCVYVWPAYRGRGVLPLLVDHVETALRPTGRPGYVLASNDRVARLCERRGLKRVPGVLFRRDFS